MREEERERRRRDREDCGKENSLLVSTALQLLTRYVRFSRPLLTVPVSLNVCVCVSCFIRHVVVLCGCELSAPRSAVIALSKQMTSQITYGIVFGVRQCWGRGKQETPSPS